MRRRAGVLLLRRRYPFEAPLAATAIMAVASFFVGAGIRALAAPVLTALLAGLVMGFGNDRRRALLGLILQLACIQIVAANFGQPGVGDVVFTTLLITAPWLAGQTARARIQVGRRLEERTA